MDNSIVFRKHKVLKEWRDPEDDGRLWTRSNDDPSLLCLPPEYDWYLKHHGHIYRVQKSENKFSWGLYIDYKESPLGWDQKAYFVRTLLLCRNGTREDAIKKARFLIPEESAIWVEDEATVEKRPEDAAFDEWYNSLSTIDLNPKKKNGKRRCPYAIGMMFLMLGGGMQNLRERMDKYSEFKIYQDIFPKTLEELKEKIRLSHLALLDRIEDNPHCEWINPLKAKIVEADALLVVGNRFLMKVANS